MLFSELYESQQVDELDLNKIGRGIGRAVGGASQAIGAAAGGIAGIPGAVRRGYQAGKNIVGQGIPDAQQPATTATPAQPAVAGKSTGAASTYSTITNPETGKLYTKAELRAKYGQTAGVQATPVTPTTTTATNDINTKQAKKAIDTTLAAVGKLSPRSKQAVIKHAQAALTKLGTAPTPVAKPTWTGRGTTKVAAPKVSAPPPAGAPTAAERANLEKRIQQAMGKQPVAESLTWSDDFDPSETLLRKIR